MLVKASALAAALIAVLCVARVDGATVRPIAMTELVDRAESVIYARAVARRSFLDPPTRTVWTETEFLVLDGPKGNPGRTVVVTEPGGVVGDIGHLFPGVPHVALNQEVVLFLHRGDGGRGDRGRRRHHGPPVASGPTRFR